MSLYIRYSGEKTKTTFLKNISTCCLLQFYIYIYIYIYIYLYLYLYINIYIYMPSYCLIINIVLIILYNFNNSIVENCKFLLVYWKRIIILFLKVLPKLIYETCWFCCLLIFSHLNKKIWFIDIFYLWQNYIENAASCG